MKMREHILSTAQRLVQQRGFNGFSYADIAAEVGIRKASLHHHFPAKTDLGIALIEAYDAASAHERELISQEFGSAKEKLEAYVALYRVALEANCVCLCGILASEALTLDPALRPKLYRFFIRNTEWLAEVLADGRAHGVFGFSGTAYDHARVILSSLQGAMLMARASGTTEDFDCAARVLLGALSK